jgi:hypothetical protein
MPILIVFDGGDDHLVYVFFSQDLVEVLLAVFSHPDALEYALEDSAYLGDVVGGELVDEAVDNVSPVGLHLVSLGHDFAVFLGGVLVEGLVLVLA